MRVGDADDSLAAGSAAVSLICRVATRTCALPLEAVIETMRPLPVEPIAGAPSFVAGLAIIRGEPVPVVDAARLLGADAGAVAVRSGRFVSLRVGTRRVALAVEAVIGVRAIPGARAELPPLLGDGGAAAIAAIATLDAELLLVLRAARLVPEELLLAGGASIT